MTETSKNKVSRRNFMGYVATGAAAAAIFGAAGYLAGQSSAPSTGPQTVTKSVTNVSTRTVTSTQPVTSTITTTTTAGAGGPAKRVVIAWNNEIIGLDPHTGQGSDVMDSPREAIFEHLINPIKPIGYGPGMLIKYAYENEQKTLLDCEVRKGVRFHNGDELTAEDIKFSIERMASPGMFVPFVWANVTQFDILDKYRLKLHFDHYDPGFIPWMGFLEAYVTPKNYFEQVGEEEFLKNLVGCGPFKFKSFNAGVLELDAFNDYWQGAPAISSVVFKPVLDAASRASEVEAGTSDFTLQVDISDFQRLKDNPNLTGMSPLIADVAFLYVAPYFEPFKDEGVRLACHYAIDKHSLVNDVMLGMGQPLSTTAAPGYEHYDPTFNFPYDPEKAKSLLAEAGYSSSNPLKITLQTTKGWVTKDFEIMQAIADMLKTVGMDVELETLAGPYQLFDNRDHGKLGALSFYVWSNSTGTSWSSVGYEMSSNSPFSAWGGMKFAELEDYTGLMAENDSLVDPVFFEPNDNKRLEIGKAAEKWVVERGLIIPLYQQSQTIVMNKNLNYEPWTQGGIKPYSMSWTS